MLCCPGTMLSDLTCREVSLSLEDQTARPATLVLGLEFMK